MARTLLIIDMQEGFRSAQSLQLQERIAHEVKLAKKRGAAIVVVEYDGFGKTHVPIQEAIGDYKLQATVHKNRDDGSEEVFIAANENGFDIKHWRVCGVNIAYCVNKTVSGLRGLMAGVDIEVKEDACNCSVGKDSWKIFDRCNGQFVKHV